MTHGPLITVGMPAYNAGSTIRDSIMSMLDQRGVDLELVISDNASTDDTWDIIEDCRRMDRRIVAIRQVENIGANGNYSAVFHAAQGQYFKWASSNDWCAPAMLEECFAALESNSEAVLAAPRTRLFAESTMDAVDYKGDVAFDDPDGVIRFIRLLGELNLNNLINGLIRSDALRRTRLIEHYPGADVVLMANLALLGRMLLLPGHHFYRRMDASSATSLMTAEANWRHHYPKKSARALLPRWRFKTGLMRAVLSAGLPLTAVVRALACVGRRIYWDRKELARDLVDAMRYMRAG